MRSGLLVLGVLAVVHASCARMPTPEEANDAVLTLRIITTGPYRLVRHPIYLGLALLAMGEALAFVSWIAVLNVLCGIIPTFAWRAHAEETLLRRTFGESYGLYRKHTKMIIPRLL